MHTVRVTTKWKEREFEDDSFQRGKKVEVLCTKLVAYNYAGASASVTETESPNFPREKRVSSNLRPV